jgi:hypothetical protein
MQRYGLVKEAPGPLRLAAAQVALATLDPHNFAAAGDVEAALGPFMSLDFGQFKSP